MIPINRSGQSQFKRDYDDLQWDDRPHERDASQRALIWTIRNEKKYERGFK